MKMSQLQDNRLLELEEAIKPIWSNTHILRSKWIEIRQMKGNRRPQGWTVCLLHYFYWTTVANIKIPLTQRALIQKHLRKLTRKKDRGHQNLYFNFFYVHVCLPGWEDNSNYYKIFIIWFQKPLKKEKTHHHQSSYLLYQRKYLDLMLKPNGFKCN